MYRILFLFANTFTCIYIVWLVLCVMGYLERKYNCMWQSSSHIIFLQLVWKVHSNSHIRKTRGMSIIQDSRTSLPGGHYWDSYHGELSLTFTSVHDWPGLSTVRHNINSLKFIWTWTFEHRAPVDFIYWAPSQYPKRRLSVRSRQVSKPRDLYLELSDRSEIW